MGTVWEIICKLHYFMSGEYFDISNSKLDVFHFYAKVSKSVAVLCLPGLGYDTYRIWETLLLG